MEGCLCAKGTGLRTSMSLNILLGPVLLQRSLQGSLELSVVATWLHLMWCALVCTLSGPVFRGWSEVEIKTCHEV